MIGENDDASGMQMRKAPKKTCEVKKKKDDPCRGMIFTFWL
jgi:hypothetical protein